MSLYIGWLMGAWALGYAVGFKVRWVRNAVLAST